MTQSIFLDNPKEMLTFDGAEKYAGTVAAMGDNADNWPREVMSEAYRQLPYLSEFSADIGLDRISEEDGYAFGSIVVRPSSHMTSKEEGERPLPTIHIPVILQDMKLSPLDVFAKGKAYYHLSEGRFREALFRPDVFDAARDRPWEPNMYSDLQPPLESGGGSGGGGVKLGYDKEAGIAVLDPILPKLHGMVQPDHIARVKLAFDSSPALRAAIGSAPVGVRAAFASAMELDPSDPTKTAEVAYNSLPATVVQLRKLGAGRYKVKWANSELYAPQEQEMDELTANELVGDLDLVGHVEGDGSVTASPDAAIKQTLDSDEAKVIDTFGLWCVQDTSGADLTGWCFPQVLSFDLQPLPLTLFTNGSVHALQDRIAGKMVGKSTELPKGAVRGYGCFYYIDHGTARAFVPMNIQNVYRGPNGEQMYMGTLKTGETVTLHLGQGMKTVAKSGENEYVIPEDISWMPLRGETELQAEPLLLTKVAFSTMGQLISDGTYYTFRGPAFAKLAGHQKQGLRRLEAEFLGVAAGIHPHFVKEALDKTHLGEIVEIGGLKILGSVGEQMALAREKIASRLKNLDHPIRNYSLIKEAATMLDAMTADKILGLGFITPENMSAFVDSLPSFELCASKLAEMLIAVRLGMEGPPELAIERSLVALDDVIHGLRRLRQQETPSN